MKKHIIVFIIIGLLFSSCSSERTPESGVGSGVSSEHSKIQDGSSYSESSDADTEAIHSDKDHISDDFRVLNSGTAQVDIVSISGSSEGAEMDVSRLDPWFTGSNGYENYYNGSKVWLSEDVNDYVQADESLIVTVIDSLEYVSDSELPDEFNLLFNDPQIGDGLYQYLTRITYEYSDEAVGNDAHILVDSYLFPLSNYCMRYGYNSIPIGQINNVRPGQIVYGVDQEIRYRAYPLVESGITDLYDGANSFVRINKYSFELGEAIESVSIVPITDLEDNLYSAMENYRAVNRGMNYGDITAFAAELCYIPCYPADSYSLEVADHNGMLIPTWVVYCYSTETGLFSLFIDPSDGSDLIKNGL